MCRLCGVPTRGDGWVELMQLYLAYNRASYNMLLDLLDGNPPRDPSLREVMIRVPHVGAEQGTQLSQTKQQVLDALRKGGIGGFTEHGTQIVGPPPGG